MTSSSPLGANSERWRRIEEICEGALGLEPTERGAYLAAEYGPDEDLRREVEALLAHEGSAEGFLAMPVDAVAARVFAAPPERDLVGQRLGDYDIVARLGAGGMGVVYRAKDRRLGRDVALKVLPAALEVDPARLARFEREARLLATVNHPHIGAIYGFVEADGIRALVLELIEGETLAAVLGRGRLPVERTLALAAQIADALDHAHRRGVTHRDLKPSNVMLTKSGVKLLDFGVARWRLPLGVEPATGASESLSTLTGTGMIPGTVQYMAPEQLEGKEADGRTDIFALGAVVYEMATGRRPFEAETRAGLVAAIIGSDPPLISTLQTGVPASLDRTVRKCLAKDPDARWQSASDLADELNWIIDQRAESPGRTRASGDSGFRDGRWWLIASLLSVLAAGAAWLLTPTTPTTAFPAARFTVELPAGAELLPTTSYAPALAFSPDGRHLVYAAMAKGATQLFIRAMNEVESRAIDGTGGGKEPFFSPDNRWVGFVSGQTVKRVAMSVGTPMTVASGVSPVGASWGPDDRIVLGGWRQGLSVVSASGGPLEEVTTLDPALEQSSHRQPQFLPGGRAVIFTAGPPAGGPWYEAEIVAQSLETRERHVLIRGGAQAHYVPTGHLVYARAATLFAVPFDAKSLRVMGPPVAVLAGVAEDQTTGASQFTVSATGSLAYITGGLKRNDVVWVDRRGNAVPLIAGLEPRYYLQPRLSPDGRQLAIQVSGADDDIWVYDIGRKTLDRFTSGANHISPEWTPDSRYITFLRTPPSGPSDLLRRPADGSGPEETILPGLTGVPHSWSRMVVC